MDNALKLLQGMLGKLTIQEKTNFVKFPLIILWICMPLALYGYIITQDQLLYNTFICLIVFNSLVSIIIYTLITKAQQQEVKIVFESLDKSIKNLVTQLTILIDYTSKKIYGGIEIPTNNHDNNLQLKENKVNDISIQNKKMKNKKNNKN